MRRGQSYFEESSFEQKLISVLDTHFDTSILVPFSLRLIRTLYTFYKSEWERAREIEIESEIERSVREIESERESEIDR